MDEQRLAEQLANTSNLMNQHLPRSERVLRAQVIPGLSALLTQKDRQTLADVAAQGMAQGVLEMVQVDTIPPVAV